MIKGILALFRTGIIFNPMVLLGILLGFIAMGTLSDEQLHALYTNYHLYLLMLFISVLYVNFFRRTYFVGGLQVDWKSTIQTMIGYFLMFAVSFIFSMLFITFISFGDEQEMMKEPDLPDFSQVETELKNHQQELQKNYDAIMQAVSPTVQ